jgi:hypothetical protein
MDNKPEIELQEVRKSAMLLCGAMLMTFTLLRAWLHLWPNTDLNVGQYNIHHLFTGMLLVVIGGIPLAVIRSAGRWRHTSLIVFGSGLGMALDEWVYLIATDGTNASYLLPVSFWGAIVTIGLACGYVCMLVLWERVRKL